jgi:hypothetical protein
MRSRQPVDVAVIGGGTAGAVAAIAAGRTGARTAVVEQYGFLGGVATTGMVFPGVFDGEGKRAAGGLLQELFDRVNVLGGSVEHVKNPTGASVTPNEPELVKFALMDMALDAGVIPVLHSFTVDTVVEGDRVRGVVIANKSGLAFQPAEVVVDATGDADVAARGGAEFEKGRSEDGVMQPITLIFRMSGVNLQEIFDYLRANPDELRVPYNHARSKGEADHVYPADYYERNPGSQLEIFSTLLSRKWPDWEGKDHFHISTLPGSDHVTVNVSRVQDLDATDADELSRASWQLQKQVGEMVRWLRAEAPGFGNARLLSVPFQVGVRETRRIRGVYRVTAEDVLSAAQFDDRIGRGAYPLDIHDPRSGVEVMGRTVTGRGINIVHIQESYSVPYRCLVPERVDGLLAAGRCVSATHEAAGSLRGQAVCMVTGEAAGTAAGLAALGGVSPRGLDVSELQQTLAANGVVLDR